MAHMHQEVYIKWGFGTPRLKGRLHPILVAPIRRVIKPFIKDKLPLYMDPLPLKPVVPVAVEPVLKEPIEAVIPAYIGELNEQQENFHQAPVDKPATNKDGASASTAKVTPYPL